MGIASHHLSGAASLVVLAAISAAAVAGTGTVAPLSAAAVEAFRTTSMDGALIRGQRDLDTWLAGEATRADDPLAPLSAGARRRFLAKLVFQGPRTVGLDTADLESELTLSQAYRVLSLFGWQWAVVDLPEARIETDADRAVDAWRAVLANAT